MHCAHHARHVPSAELCTTKTQCQIDQRASDGRSDSRISGSAHRLQSQEVLPKPCRATCVVVCLTLRFTMALRITITSLACACASGPFRDRRRCRSHLHVRTSSNWGLSRRTSRVVFVMFCSQSSLSCVVCEAVSAVFCSYTPAFDQSVGRGQHKPADG